MLRTGWVVAAQDPGLAVLELDALVFTAWQTDRSQGLDAIMRAPTRELVSQLNQRTRSHRLDTEPNHRTAALPVVMLADGNPASAGDQVISRTNNRALRITAGPQVIKVQAPKLASVDPRHQVAVTSAGTGGHAYRRFRKGFEVFAQVIQGKVSNPDAIRAAGDQWMQDLAPGAEGWLGSTAGTTDDGRFILVARFESEEAARRNSDRPEQSQWWAETEKLFDGGATFHDSTDVTIDVQGDPDQAGFVQVLQGRGTDPDRARELMTEDSDKWAAFRPDVIGSVAVGHDDGAYTMVMYFTSEAEAREGERKEVPPELQANMEEMNKLSVGEPEFFDLKEPIIYSPR